MKSELTSSLITHQHHNPFDIKEITDMSTEVPQIETNRDARLYGMLCHLLALCGMFFPFGNILGPLVVWLVKKDDYQFVDIQGKESLNFQISMVLYSLGLTITCIGIFLVPVVILMALIYPIIAAVKANDGIPYRYPFTIKFV